MSQINTIRHLQATQLKDYIELTKPKVVLLILLTALVGMVIPAAGLPDLDLLILALLGIGLLSGSAAAINHVVDYKIDAQMARTYHRPVVKGRLTQIQALSFALSIGLLGFCILWFTVNQLTAWLTFASLVGYAIVYTLYLKRATPQNIVIGGLAGAMPPLLGWTAVTNTIDPNALLLVMIIFAWTPPHFWALAIHRKQDYAKAEIPMLPVTHGEEFTKTMILLYTCILSIVCIMPWLSGQFGLTYLLVSAGLNFRFIWLAVQLKWFDTKGLAFKTFKYSIWHLMFLFILMVFDFILV
ncbi:heme o synthase [Catenovulum maritimum]|uniref:Protoheme IX farnesyltransferase n=1 Tax=Catenovulum maritimum TaxID=1513271 RepID=A0A0J8GNJ4_9ALTE|nr:heme o synthase [Catenovulum maritimum]KMT64395.1 protoheme IX farnesyltransferase [Catenovulum maritimum]